MKIIPAAYAGDTCSEDKNGCSEIECFKGVKCYDIPAPGIGVICGACPRGFTGDGLKCSGIVYNYPNIVLLRVILLQKQNRS